MDVWSSDVYLRAFDGPEGRVVWRVTQADARSPVLVELSGAVGPLAPWRARLRRMLGLDVDLAPFLAAARRFAPLAALLPLAEGIRPPRFSALHEAFAAVVLFQQVSLASAVATLRRLVAALSPAVTVAGAELRAFPSADRLADAPEAVFRAAGASGAKARALRGAAAAVAGGALSEEALAALPSEALVLRLREVPGVGPWTASLLALRYFGRLDVFPPGDVAAAKALGELGSARLVESLGPWRGMLYYLLFVRRMARAGVPAWLR